MNNLTTKSIEQMLCLLALFLLFSYQVKAQVTIGCLEEPHGGSLLDLKEKADADSDASNSTKGVLFPKVSLKSVDSLAPLIASATDQQKGTSKGMIVYNVNANATGLNEGLCVWNGKEWTAVLGGGPSSMAKFDIDCSGKITTIGKLFKGTPLSPYGNIITLPVTVSNKGTYNIKVDSKKDNGYSFEAKGEFLNTGNHNLTLNGTGAPIKSTQDLSNVPDSIKIVANGSEYDVASKCPSLTLPQLKIEEVPVSYYFNCNQVDISNVDLNTTKTSENSYITIHLQVPQESDKAQYHIETNTVGGVKFEGSGQLNAGKQTIKLSSNGAKPTMAGKYDFFFQSNSADPRIDNCSVEIPIVGAQVNVAVWGTVGGGVWDIGSSKKGVRLILESDTLFGLGENKLPVYPVSEIVFERKEKMADLAENWDILIISYPGEPKGDEAKKLKAEIDKGKVVIHCMEGSGYSMELTDSIFGADVVKNNKVQTGTNNTKVKLTPGSPLTNGAYMDISDKCLGYGGGSNIGFTISDLSNVEIAGIRESDGSATIIRHKTKPYIMLGDGGIFCGNTVSNDPETPLLVTSDGLPLINNTYSSYANFGGAYNAHLFVNMMIWAINYRLSQNL